MTIQNHFSTIFLMIFGLLLVFPLIAQEKIEIEFHILDEEEKLGLPSAHIQIDSLITGISDTKGKYEISLEPGEHSLNVSFIGLETLKTTIVVAQPNEVFAFYLKPSENMLKTLVVSDSRYSQKYEHSAISIDVIGLKTLQTKSPINVQKAIEQLPSVHMIGDQINIRGGAGWTYGAGSRVLLLQDGVPMMEGAESGIQWHAIEPEATQQIEMVKGASSVLYGANALNGTINVITRTPQKTPYTSISMLHGMYDKPDRVGSSNSDGPDLVDWNAKSNLPLMFSNYTIYHDQKIGNLELSGSFNHFREQYYIQNNKENKRLRAFAKIAHDLKEENKVYYGLSATYIDNLRGETFLFNGDQDPYRSYDLITYDLHAQEFAIRPFIEFGNDSTDWTHNINGQYYKVNYIDSVNNYSNLYYGNYLAQRRGKHYTFSTGFSGSFTDGQSEASNYKAKQYNAGAYAQLEYKWKNLTTTLGARYEYNNENGREKAEPVKRLALNYALNETTFLKGSYGEAVRFPSLLELYFQRNSGEITFLPNPDLKAETGWTAELGILRTARIGSWHVSTELTGFLMRFDNMTELSFGVWGGDVDRRLNPLGIGFKAVNIGKSEVSGIEVDVRASGDVGDVGLDVDFGYTFMNPIIGDKDYIYESYKDKSGEIAADISDEPLTQAFIEAFVESIGDITYMNTSSDPSILKYRHKFLLNLDLQAHYKRFHPSVNVRYNSFMKNVDNLFESYVFNQEVSDVFSNVSAFSSETDLHVQDLQIKNSRERHQNGDWFFDLRLAYDVSDEVRVMFAVENVFNREYQVRPGLLGAPRVFSLQANLKL
ncbi:MAG: TonB-dependent receptor [Flavobacteriales bacterium]